MKKQAKDVKSGDVMVDRLGFLRAVWYVVTVPSRVIGTVINIVFTDRGNEAHDFDDDITYLSDENQ